MRRTRTATNESAFTNVASEDNSGTKESRGRAKSLGPTAVVPDDVTPQQSSSQKPGKSPSGVTAGSTRDRSYSPGQHTPKSPRGSCDSRTSMEVPGFQDDAIGPTMRHLVTLVQRLLSNYQFACAARLLEQLTKEVLLTQILDTPLPGTYKLSSNLLDFADSERNKYNHLMNSFVQNVTELVGSDFDKKNGGAVELGSNLLDILEKRDDRNRKTRAKSTRKTEKDTSTKDAKGTLSSALGLQSDDTELQMVSSQTEKISKTLKRRSEAMEKRGSMLDPLDIHPRRESCRASFSHLGPSTQALLGRSSVSSTQALTKELTGAAPRMSLTHALGLQHLNVPPAVPSDGTNGNEAPGFNMRSSTNSEESMIEDDASESRSVCSHLSGSSANKNRKAQSETAAPSTAAVASTEGHMHTPPPAPIDDPVSRSPKHERQAKDDQDCQLRDCRRSRESDQSLGSCPSKNIIGAVEKPNDQNSSNENELEVSESLLSREASSSPRDKDEVTRAFCRACGNRYMPDAIFCRKCGQRRFQTTPSNSPSHRGENDAANLQGLGSLLSWRLQNSDTSQKDSEEVNRRASSKRSSASDNVLLRRRSLDDAVRWRRSSTVTLPLTSSISLPAHGCGMSEASSKNYLGSLGGMFAGTFSGASGAAGTFSGAPGARASMNEIDMSLMCTGADIGHPSGPPEIKVTEPAEAGFKETRFKLTVRNEDGDNDDNCDASGSGSDSEEAVEEMIVRPTGSIVARGAALHAKGHSSFLKVKRAKSMAGIHDIFKENLDEDRAAYLSSPSHFLIVHPNSMLRMSWDVSSLIIILFEAIILPLGLCFDMYPPDAMMWISTSFFIPDFVLNMFTGFYHNGLLILRQKIILKRYFMGWAAIDFLSTVPWEAFFNTQRGQAGIILKFAKISKLMRVLRLLRVLKLKALIQRVEDMCSSYIVLVTLSITKIVAFYMLVCHWTACVWGWMGIDDSDLPNAKPRSSCEPDGPCENGIGIDDSPWRRRYGLIGENPFQHYLVALQFSTGLLTGAELQLMPGYWLERVFITMMMIVSFLVCSMIISQIVVVMDKINQDNSEYLEHSRIIRDFMVSRGMPIKLQTKVKRYLEYQFKSRKVVHQNHDILMKLSPYLRMEIQEHMNKAILENHPFFKGMEVSVLSQVCSLAQSVLYAPGDVVMRKGQIESLICFIVRGQLQIVEARKGVSIYIKAPAWTGDRGLFVATIRMHTVTCSMHSELLTICQQDLIDLVSCIPAAEAYIKEYCKKVLSNDPSTIFCHFCRMSRHDMDTCKELTAALKRDQNQVTCAEEPTKEAWYQRAKKTMTKTQPAPKKKMGRDSCQGASHITVQGRPVSNGHKSSLAPEGNRNTSMAAAALAAWEEH